MNKKIIAAFLAVFLLLSCCFTVFALPSLGIGDIFDIYSSIDFSKYTSFSEQEWSTMSSSERANQLNYVISSQNGNSFISDNSDFINDTSLSYGIYNSLSNELGLTLNLTSKQYLESSGLADFGMGYYGKDGHSSGKFGEGTVADTLNDDFIDYYKKNPYTSDKMYIFPDSGMYIVAELCVTSYEVGYYLNLYNSDGVWLYQLAGQGEMNPPNDDNVNYYSKYISFKDFSITDPSTGAYTVTRHWYHVDFDCYFDTVHTGVCNYLANNSDSDFTDSVSLDTVIHNDNGDFLNVKLTSDGVTYEGNTYNYNDDNSVTINGDKYYITLNPSDVDEDYYKQFLGDTINNYYNYYTTEGKEFDDTDIISSLKSIFTSLETFRSYFYSEIKQFYDSVRDGFKGISSTITRCTNNIIKAINSLGGSSDLDDEALAEYQKKLQSAVDSRFGAVLSLRDLVDKALSAYKDSNVSQIDFKYKAFTYSIDFSKWFNENNLQSIRFLMAAFIYVSYAFNTFRRIPSYIYSGGDR